MRTVGLKAIGLGLLIVVAGGAIIALKKTNASLRDRIASLASQNRQTDALRQENERLRAFLTRSQEEGTNAQQTVRAELVNAQSELAAAEKNRVERRALHAKQVTAQVANTNPETGITRLEHFKNLGRGTPAAALQTAVWAVMNKDDATLASTLSITGPAREKVEALLTRLPSAERVKFPSPESLAVVAITGEILKTDAIAVTGSTFKDASHAVVMLRLPEPGRPQNTKEGKIPMQLGPQGWQIVVPERAIDGVIRRISDRLPDPEKK
jgi:hypothetical protein